jgi:hypothetical protein
MQSATQDVGGRHLAHLKPMWSAVAVRAMSARLSLSPQLRICSVSSCSLFKQSGAAMPSKGGCKVTPDCNSWTCCQEGPVRLAKCCACRCICCTKSLSIIKIATGGVCLLTCTWQLCCSLRPPLLSVMTLSCCKVPKSSPARKAPSYITSPSACGIHFVTSLLSLAAQPLSKVPTVSTRIVLNCLCMLVTVT